MTTGSSKTLDSECSQGQKSESVTAASVSGRMYIRDCREMCFLICGQGQLVKRNS